MAWRHGLIDHSPDWVRRWLGPTGVYLDMLFVDHGILRLIYLNRHQLDDEVWRSAQPAPHQIKSLYRSGLRTIINLRGERKCGSYWMERDLCKELGIELVNFQVRSRGAPRKETLHGAKELFTRIEYPMLMHCKSGSDRAGLMSVLYKHIRQGVPIEEAVGELSLRYGHIRQADTGILDYFFERYLEDNKKNPMPFLEWVENVYDPEELHRTFKANGWANQLVNVILRRE